MQEARAWVRVRSLLQANPNPEAPNPSPDLLQANPNPEAPNPSPTLLQEARINGPAPLFDPITAPLPSDACRGAATVSSLP